MSLVVMRRFALLFGLWLVLTGNEPSAWPVGLAAAAVATAIGLKLRHPQSGILRLGAVARLAPGFLWLSLLGALDVAWRAFHPRMPLRPCWIRYPVRLPAGPARAALGNELSLMPGTLAAGGQGRVLLVHCLDGGGPMEAQIAAEERRVGQAIGLTLEEHHG